MKSSDKAIQDYFSALLDEPAREAPVKEPLSVASVVPLARVERAKPARREVQSIPLKPETDEKPVVVPVCTKVASAPLQKLLDGMTPREVEIIEPVKPEIEVAEPVAEIVVPEVEIAAAQEQKGQSALQQPPAEPEEPFQVLYFEVAGVTLAVPLEELGGIYPIEDDSVRHLVGKPGWFMGLMPYRERQLNVVDTALWVMPEKYNEELAETLNYQYLVMLKDSEWGLACEKLITTRQVEPSAINWRQTIGKRPWLRGMVKEKMCALLNVDALTELLDTGLDSQTTQ